MAESLNKQILRRLDNIDARLSTLEGLETKRQAVEEYVSKQALQKPSVNIYAPFWQTNEGKFFIKALTGLLGIIGTVLAIKYGVTP